MGKTKNFPGQDAAGGFDCADYTLVHGRPVLRAAVSQTECQDTVNVAGLVGERRMADRTAREVAARAAAAELEHDWTFKRYASGRYEVAHAGHVAWANTLVDAVESILADGSN